MKRRIFTLSLAVLVLVLSGCSPILQQEYRSVSRHVSHTSDDSEDTSVLRAENYSDLVNNVQFFVSIGMSKGVVHLYQYSGDVEADLDAVCQELLTRDALCAWALQDISWIRSPMISYDECVFTFTYRVDPAQISSIQTIIGSSAIREQMGQALSQFDRQILIQTSSYYARNELLLSLIQQAYYAQPGYALGYPDVSIGIYPQEDRGTQRLVEITLSYPYHQDVLQERSQRVATAAASLVGFSPSQGTIGCWLLYSRLVQRNSYANFGEPSVFNALVTGKADSEGIAMAYRLLCDQAGIHCLTVQGTLDGAPHWWNMVELEDGWHHLDVTANLDQNEFLCSDGQISQRYTWDKENYPPCPDPPEDDGNTVDAQDISPDEPQATVENQDTLDTDTPVQP